MLFQWVQLVISTHSKSCAMNKHQKEEFDFRPRKKPNMFIEAIAWLFLYGGPFLVVYSITKLLIAFVKSL